MSDFIYVSQNGRYDRSRWLQLLLSDSGQLTFDLQDLCLPGKLSTLRQMTCPLDVAVTSLACGTLQITSRDGFMLLRNAGDLVSIEFRGVDDTAVVKASVLREDLERGLRTRTALVERERDTAGR